MILKQSKLILFLMLVSSGLFSNPVYTLNDLIDMANQTNPVMDVIQAKEDAAKAGITVAEQYLNPNVGVAVGPSKTRQAPIVEDKNWAIGISQPIEFSDVRSARKQIAESNLKFVDEVNKGTKINLMLNIKSAFYSVIHNQEILKLAEADQKVIQDIRDRVELRVNVGESPRYELIKADTELLAARRDAQAAKLRIQESKFFLKGLIGKSIPDEFELTGEFPQSNIRLNKVDVTNLIENSPRLKQLKAASSVFENKIKLEKNLVNPGLTLSAGINQEPSIRNHTIRFTSPLPIWNQREGEISQAAANLREVEATYEQQSLLLKRDVNAAFQRYLIAKEQVMTFEESLLDQAQSVLKVVEAAYRFGERGILEYLDAQRTQRVVRKDYLSARLDYIVSIMEMEQLLGSKIME